DVTVELGQNSVACTRNGTWEIAADNGNAGGSDGHIDTVSVIDLEANPPRVIDRVVVGDAPEGLAISPTGQIAVVLLLRGSAAVPKTAWYANKVSQAVILKIDGKTVTNVGRVDVGTFAEGLAFSPDGKYVYVGNFVDGDVSILKVDGTTVTDTGKRLKLPGAPASMRGRAR